MSTNVDEDARRIELALADANTVWPDKSRVPDQHADIGRAIQLTTNTRT